MARAHKFVQLPVLNQSGRWLMRFRGKRVEFVDRRSALREAILEAFEHSRNGTPTQVVCIDEQLAIEIVWTYGVDPEPAPADMAQWVERRRSVAAAGGHPPRPARMPAH
jgi:hypothetical protein